MPSSRQRRRPEPLLHVLILQGLLSLSACTTPQPKGEAPRIPPPPTPAECRKQAFEAFAPGLTGLPADYLTAAPSRRAKMLLLAKAEDTENYQLLRAQAIRCAPER